MKHFKHIRTRSLLLSFISIVLVVSGYCFLPFLNRPLTEVIVDATFQGKLVFHGIDELSLGVFDDPLGVSDIVYGGSSVVNTNVNNSISNIGSTQHEGYLVTIKLDIQNHGTLVTKIPLPSIPIKLDASKVAMVTYYAPQTNKDHKIYFSEDLYLQTARKTMSNIASYTHHHGIPFFFRNNHMVDTHNKAAYWGKMDVIKHYLKVGFEWVIWTDIDVLFMNFEKSLVDEWLKKASDDQSLAMVLECTGIAERYHTVRSGFFAVRNTPDGFKFLEAWKNTYDSYRLKPNPEQTALEDMMKDHTWRNMTYVTPPDGIHTYSDCYEAYDKEVISLHFPGPQKDRVEYYRKKTNMKENIDFDIEFDVQRPITEQIQCWGLVCVKTDADLKKYLTVPKNRADMLTVVNDNNELGFGFVYVIVSDFTSKGYKSISMILKSMGVNFSTIFSIQTGSPRIDSWKAKHPNYLPSDNIVKSVETLLILEHAISMNHSSILIVEEETDWSVSSSAVLNMIIPTLPPDWDYVVLHWSNDDFHQYLGGDPMANLRSIKPNQDIKLKNIAYGLSKKAFTAIFKSGMESGLDIDKLIAQYINNGFFTGYAITPMLVDDVSRTKSLDLYISNHDDEPIEYKSRLDFSSYNLHVKHQLATD
ncbi:hypothetical protein HDV02_004499 [Globomyces sp. JEL0801]|nr:hypothetical protein HDV02_004499 [Globomyces sp. JEL0801]